MTALREGVVKPTVVQMRSSSAGSSPVSSAASSNVSVCERGGKRSSMKP